MTVVRKKGKKRKVAHDHTLQLFFYLRYSSEKNAKINAPLNPVPQLYLIKKSALCYKIIYITTELSILGNAVLSDDFNGNKVN